MTPDQHAQRLAVALGDRLPPEWREAYRAVSRHLFIPDRAHHATPGQPDTLIDRQADPDGWLQAVYSEDIIVTQYDQHGRSSSSCSMPEMVFAMLQLLDVQPGQRALEIGTGTGWNAALLAYRLGDEQVVSVEVDPEVADGARKALAEADRHPTVITGDGADAYPQMAPYDRVIATCTVRQIPYPWVTQTRPGAIIVTPVGTPLDSGAIARLTVAEDGTASGQFRLGSSFMPMRAHRFTVPDEPDDFDQRADTSQLRVAVSDTFEESPLLAISHRVPACKLAYDHGEDGTVETVWLLAADSWASVAPGTGMLRQLGRRRLWDEVEAAYRWWDHAGRPEFTRFGLTVTPDRQWVWLDDPDGPYSWPMPL